MKRILLLVPLLILAPALSLADGQGIVSADKVTKTDKARHVPPKAAIEQFMCLTALWMMELEWTYGYDNRTPSANERAKVLMAADLSACPEDFREAWTMQAQKPQRNYIAPLLRKYDVRLAPLRGQLEKGLKRINPGVRPQVPLYDEEERVPRFDPSVAGSRDAILRAVRLLRAELSGVDPARAEQWHRAVKKVMLQFTLSYVETAVCMNVAGITRRDVEAMFNSIDVKECPPDFIEAWEHDLPSFRKGRFAEADLRIPAVCKRHGVDESALLDYVKRKMEEWDLRTPTAETQPQFRKDFHSLRANILDNR